MMSQETPLVQNTADSRFASQAIVDEFLQFLEGYIEAE